MAKNIKKLFALILAISMVMSLSVNTFAAYGQSVCDEEAHTHENACYKLTCGKTEADLDLTCGMEAHEHTEACHVHGEGCDEACALTPCEIEIHAHDDKCYTSHVHVEECYDFEALTWLPCEVHGDDCYTAWYGDEVELDVEEGTDGYTYMLFGDITDDGNKANDYYYYETSNHTLKKEVTTGGAVHLIALIDTAKYHGDWTPDGVYNCGESNFDVVYCCDATIRSEAGDYYKRLNLEDSEYFTAEEAKKLRAILANSYPFVSVEEAKAALKEAGFEQADELDRSELISATQAAVWSIANKDSGDSYDYNQTASTAKKYTWGGYLHDFSNEHKNFTDGYKNYKYFEDIGNRINALRDFLLDQDEVSPKRTQVVISSLTVMESIPVQEKEGTYTVALRVQLNNSGSSKSKDDLAITVYVDGEAAKTVDVEYGTEAYDLTVEAGADSEVVAVVSGTQVLPKGVYFYAPKPQDIDGDGIATSREVSQNLIGVAGGITPIHAEAEIELELDEEPPVTGTLQLQKTDEYGEILTGAEFALYVVGETSTMYVDTYAVDENGQLTVEGLLPGDYELEETVVPEGYLEPDGVFTFSIDAEGTLVGDDVADGVMTVVNEQPKYTVTYKYVGSVQPEDPSELPAAETYKYGETVTVAEDATAEGYVFSGWSKTGTFEMPAEDVVITGSWDVASTPAGTATLDKTAEWSDEKFVADVTLSVGGDSEDLSSDIVMIIGRGPSSDYAYLIETIKKMLIATDGTETKIKLGLVTFADTTEEEIVLPLTVMEETDSEDLAEDDMDYIIAEACKKAGTNYSGVNLESALITARDMLVADDDVPAERKHMIVVSTGLAYYFDDEDGQACTIVGSNGYGNYMHGNKYWLKARNNSTNTSSGYKIPTWAEVKNGGEVDYQASWDNYWSMVVGWIEADQDTYVYDLNGQTYKEFLTDDNGVLYGRNYVEIKPNNNNNLRYGYAMTDAEDIAALKDAVPYFAGAADPEVDANAGHALNYERAQYEAWVVYNEMQTDIGKSFRTVLGDKIKGLGFNCYAIANGAPESDGEDRWLQSNQIGYNFMRMLGGENTVNWRDHADFFAPIENKIMYSVGVGSSVDDYMGYGDEYDFDFIDELDKITLKVGQTTYSTTKLDTPTEGFDSSYAFTAPEADEPTFWLDYVKGNGTSEEMFHWTYGENISNFAPVVLDYQVRLVKVPNDNLDELVYKTNKEATLKDPDGDDIEEFPIPELEIYSVTYEYVGDIQPENAPELPATDYYTEGATVTVADDPSAEGYVFSGWSETGTFEMPAEDVVITGSWDVASTPMAPKFAYEVRYFLEELDGSYEEVTADFYRAFDELGATVSPAEKAYEHYVLNTELSDAQGTVIAPSVVNGELNILRMNVYFDREEYTVTYEYTGSVQPEDPSELPAAETYKFGETVTVAEDATAEGYVFSGWSKTGTFEMPAEDVVITGSWKVATSQFVPKFAYEVRYFLEELDGSYEEVTADFYRAFDELGATVSPAEKAYEHYVLNTELSDAQGTVIAPSVVNGELNILRMNVYFDREEYTVTYKYTGSVQPEDPSELPATETYKFGETVTVAEDATAEGYVFSGWSKTGTFEMPAEDVVITGSWKVATSQFVPKFAYEVRYFLEELDGSYEEVTADFYRAFDELGATVSPAEKAYEHYVLNTELSDAQGTVIAPSVVNGELNILRMNVYFDREEYTVTYEYTGSVQPEDPSELPAAETYKYGETVTVAEDATAEGYVFSGWSKTGTFEMPAEDVVITGSWKVAASQFVPKFAYEVRYFQEQRDGSYEEVTADFYRAFDELGATVSPAEKAYEHYVLNTELSDAQGTVIAPSVVDGELNILRMNVYFDLVRYTVTYIDRGEEVQFTEELISGDEIPGCEDPETYYDKYHKYSFQNWILVEGEEGEDSTIGTTDLVYESVYKRTNKPSPTPPSDSDDDPDVEILDDEVPLAEIPALFGDDHYAYIIGYTDGLVHPEANITRAEVATIFFRLLDEEIRNTLMTDVNDFPDVEKGQWYNHAVSTLSSMGIVLGRNDGNFYPNDFITRAEFAAIAARFDPSGNPEGVFFSDIAGHWAEREIIIAANNGWVEGYNGLFRPDDYITRAEAMTLVNRVLHRLPETEHDLLEYMVIWPDNMNVDAWYYLAVQEATNSHDYIRKTDPIYESWTEFIEPYDWSLLEY